MIACIYIYIYTCMYVCMYACMYVYVCIYIYMCVCMYVCMYVCMCMCIYIVYRFFSTGQFTMCTTETVHFRNVAITLVCVGMLLKAIPIHALTPNVGDVDK